MVTCGVKAETRGRSFASTSPDLPEIDGKVALRACVGTSPDLPEAREPINIEGIAVMTGETGSLKNGSPLGGVATTWPSRASTMRLKMTSFVFMSDTSELLNRTVRTNLGHVDIACGTYPYNIRVV